MTIHFLQRTTHNLSQLVSEPSCLHTAPVLISPFYLLYSFRLHMARPFKPCVFCTKCTQMRPHVLHPLPRPRSAHSWATCQVPTTLPLVCQIWWNWWACTVTHSLQISFHRSVQAHAISFVSYFLFLSSSLSYKHASDSSRLQAKQ